jgi:hypothetical protein
MHVKLLASFKSTAYLDLCSGAGYDEHVQPCNPGFDEHLQVATLCHGASKFFELENLERLGFMPGNDSS